MLTPAPRLRHKECFDDALELAPVRLVGGFICVDLHVGCVGCAWCLNRRYPVQRRVLEERIHRSFAEAGVSTARVAAWIRGLPSYRDARVPVRIGHATDLVFEEEEASALVEALDPGHPVVLASRFPAGAATRRVLASHRNVLLHLTVTPGGEDAERALASVRDLPAERVFLMFCPLVAGTAPALRRLLDQVPAGMSVGFKEIDVSAIPGCAAFEPLSRPELEGLVAEARRRGHRWLPFFGCQVRTNLGLPCSYFERARRRAPETCAACTNRPVCAGRRRPSSEEVAACAASLGLETSAVRMLETGLELGVREPAARADETFLSEKLGLEIQLSSIARAERRETVQVSEAVLRRWQRTGFYPVDALRSAGRRMAELIWPSESARRGLHLQRGRT